MVSIAVITVMHSFMLSSSSFVGTVNPDEITEKMQGRQDTKKLKPINRKPEVESDSKKTKLIISFLIIIILAILLWSFPWNERIFEDPIWWKFNF